MNGKKPFKDEVRLRKKYEDHSRPFMDWARKLGLEQSFFGRLIYNFETKWGGPHFVLIFSFSLLLSTLINLEIGGFTIPNVGRIATEDIKSPVSFDLVDEEATKYKRLEAEITTPPVFDEDQDVYEGVYTKLYSSFREMRVLYRGENWGKSVEAKETNIKNFFKYKPDFEKVLGIEVSNVTFEWLIRKKFSALAENVIRRALTKWSIDKIYDGSGDIVKETDEKIVLRDLNLENEEYIIESRRLVDARRKSQFTLGKIDGVQRFDKTGRRHLLKLAHGLLVPNLSYNKEETIRRRAKAKEQVLPVQFSIKKNQPILTAGTEVLPSHIALLTHVKSIQSGGRFIFKSILASLLLLLITIVFFSYLKRFTIAKIKVETKDLTIMGTITVVVVMITKLFLYIGDAALADKIDSIPSSFLIFASPYASGAMMAGLLLVSGELIWIYSTYLAVVLSLMMGMDLSFFLVAAISGVAGARGVYKSEKRNDVYMAGLRTGVVSALIIGIITLLTHMGEESWVHDVLFNSLAGLIGGLFSAMIVMMITPLLESMFSATTDLKLLELSSLNHPLMKEMMVKAPGTYQHCMAVGNMCDVAANAIGANALLAKVMAYYHDIGKIEYSHYFIENQRPGLNPHDNVTPFMSKTIIIAHVKDGAEIGLKHKLGKPIIDGILQHHGTSLISYFYRKAINENEDGESEVKEAEFRYPGPKPQFKEAAIVMLADSVEAAARAIEAPTAVKLHNLVENIIQSKFLDGQLDECNLTFRELSRMEEAFKKSLVSIYHHRIEYPDMKKGKIVDVKAKAKKKKPVDKKAKN